MYLVQKVKRLFLKSVTDKFFFKYQEAKLRKLLTLCSTNEISTNQELPDLRNLHRRKIDSSLNNSITLQKSN